MIVIFVASIMLTIAIPSFLAWLPNLHFRQATRDLFLDLQMAKQEAVKRNVNVGIELNNIVCPALGNRVPTPGGSYILFLDDGSGAGIANDGIRHADEPIIKDVGFPQDVALCGNTFGPTGTIISFQPNGIPTFPVPPVVVAPDIANSLTVNNDTGRQGTITLSIAGNIVLN
ncbi:GspH/FimT family pseudopilin [Desulfopila inferna]|nr:GspH/FimT family pseudopilin [Desulfopila inferna]